jgi:putative holliday junction resolvase
MEKRILALDYGSVRVGVAVSDPLHIIAQSVGACRNDATLFDELAAIVRQYDPGLIVVGMPFTLKGEKGKKAEEVDQFVERLKERIGIETVLWDERFTSKMAQRTLIDMGTRKKERKENKGRVDAMAAALILQSFLDQTKHSASC